VDAMKYSIQAGGKRIRPTLTLEFCRAFGGEMKKAFPFAAAVEMIHCYSLIHDDLPCMDDDDMRRGKPSCHIQFGEANALLAGDALLTLAFHTITNSPKTHGADANSALKAAVLLSENAGINGLIGGQVIDLESEGKVIREATLERLHELKTGALISAACGLGAIAANASPEKLQMAKDFGVYLGLAFQIIDDILDVTGDETTLGKPIGSDDSNQKTTYVTLYGLDKSKQIAEEYSKKAIQVLSDIDDNRFLLTLTEKLLNRNY
jgi:geranylgeranyl diphosphate synthase type II